MVLERCPWYIAGPAIGAVIVFLRATVNKPLGALGGYIDIAEGGTRPSQMGFSACLLAGIVVGGAVCALFTDASGQHPAYEGVLPASAPSASRC